MTLALGMRLGPYEILAPLGAGGMGEVYRARDTRLDRDVAIKVLPDHFAADPEHLTRFEREAKVLASLNHPNIAHLHGLEESGDVRALVMELVEGPTLADRIARGPIAIDEALPIARQIADALEAAHEQGIIHRDLKPANVKVCEDGTVKVLDFGLAKAIEGDRVNVGAVSNSPTITSPALMTGVGVLLGTAAYMAPEQAKGKPADKRSDIWAFGCVLFEMLTGKRAFEGEEVNETPAFVLTKQPDWTALPAATPGAIGRLLRRCLEKDRKRRLGDAGVARLDIDDALTAPASDAVTTISGASAFISVRWRLAVLVAAALLVGAGLSAIAVWNLRPSGAASAVTRFPILLPDGQQFNESGGQVVAASPDGTHLAYVANRRLYLRSLSEVEARPIPGTETTDLLMGDVVFSPDGQSIAFYSGTNSSGALRRVALSGGTPVTICPATNTMGISWSRDGIVFGQIQKGIMRVAATGGQPELLVGVKDGAAWGPQLLPGGEAVLFTFAPGITALTGGTLDMWDKAHVVVQSLRSGERRTVHEGGSGARYIPTGHLVYAVGGNLFATPFSLDRLEVTGDAAPVLEGVRRAVYLGAASGSVYYNVSDNGSLVYVPGPSSSSLQFDLAFSNSQGAVNPLKLRPASYQFPRISPDGTRVAVGTDDGREANIWIYDLSGTSAVRQLTLEGRNRFPVWSADSRDVAFQSDRDGDHAIFRQRADGGSRAERLTKPQPGVTHVPESWSPAGRTLLFGETKGDTSSLMALSVSDQKTARVDGVPLSKEPISGVFTRWPMDRVRLIGRIQQDSRRAAVPRHGSQVIRSPVAPGIPSGGPTAKNSSITLQVELARKSCES